MFYVFNHRKHENLRICFIFEIITQQPRHNQKTLGAIFLLAPIRAVAAAPLVSKMRRRHIGVISSAPAHLYI